MARIISANEFDSEVLKSGVPVMVDFFADWCGPCRMISSAVEEISAEFAGRASVVKVDIDKDSGLAVQYGVRGVPTLMFFRDGKNMDQIVGAVPKSAMADKLNGLVS